MKLNTAQQQLVANSMNLVLKVLKDLQIGGSVGIYAREDLYQIGSIGLCKAAHSYKPGKASFCTYAYVLIRNEIFDAMKYAKVRSRHQTNDQDWDRYQSQACCEDKDHDHQALRRLLATQRNHLNGIAQKGVDALLLWDVGFSYSEIGKMYGAPENHVRAWVARARTIIQPLLDDAV